MLVGVFDEDAEAGVADEVGRFAEDPVAGVVHFHDGADALAGAEGERFDQGGVGDGVAVEGDDLELVAAEGDAAVLDGAGVEEVEEDALALGDADGFAGAERLVVDGVGGGGNFEAVGRGVQDGGLFRLRRVGVEVLVHVDHLGGEEGFPVAQGEEEFLVVIAGVGCGVDVDEAELAGVGASVQVGHGHGVGVVPARAGEAWA